MKTLIFVVIFFMMYLLIQHFMYVTKEGLANCSNDQHDLTYKNTATIQQQQTEIDDFKKDMQSQLTTLKTQVQGFNTQMTKNANSIAANAKKIKSTVQDIQAAKKQKQAALNKAAGGL